MKTNTITTTDESDLLRKAEIENYRLLKDQKLGNPSNSPLSSEKIQSFAGLKYFEIDFKFSSKGIIKRNETRKFIELPMSGGAKLKFEEFGTVSFKLLDKTFTLSIFKNQNLPEFTENPDQLFIPFKDATSGNETYANGRYLPVSISSDETEVVIDFNQAINPYSAYNEAFVSVNPSSSPLLEISMISGERRYEDR
jgi:uncharacterized protein (DUF1684 family)